MAYKLGEFTFDSEAQLQQAKKEFAQVKKLTETYNISDPKVAKTILAAIQSGKISFKTKIGQAFIQKLKKTAGVATGGTKASTERTSRVAALSEKRTAAENDTPRIWEILLYLTPILAFVGAVLYCIKDVIELHAYQAQLANFLFAIIILVVWGLASMVTGVGAAQQERNRRVERYLNKKIGLFRHHISKKMFLTICAALVVFIVFTIAFSFFGSEAETVLKTDFVERMVGSR